MRLETIHVGELERFTARALSSYEPGQCVPVSRHRARAWAHNPLADREDVALVVAYEGQRCIGYLGMMPGLLASSAEERRIYWLSTWFVPEQYRNTGAGALLLTRILGLGRDIAVTGVSKRAAEVYEACGFRKLPALNYLRADLVSRDLLSLPMRALRRLLRKSGRDHTPGLDRAVHAVRWLTKRSIFRDLHQSTQSARSEIELREVKRLERWSSNLVGDPPKWRFHRPREVIDWMLAFPWVVEDPDRKTHGFRFRDWEPLFRYCAVEIHERGTGDYKGTVVLRANTSHSHRVVTILDYQFIHPEDERYLPAVAVDLVLKVRSDRLILPALQGASFWPMGNLDRRFRRMTRPYYCFPADETGPLATDPSSIELQLADGDLAFA